MNFDRVPAGKDVPNDCNVIVEIPMRGVPIKYDVDRLSALYRAVRSPRDLPEITTQQIAHFFEHYKDLEPGKWVRISTWVGAEEAKQEIMDGVARYQASIPKSNA